MADLMDSGQLVPYWLLKMTFKIIVDQVLKTFGD